MRLLTVLLTTFLATTPAAAAGPQASGPTGDGSASESANPQDGQPLNLPVSLDRIREGLKQTPLVTLRGLNELAPEQAAHFKVDIEEHQKIEELLATLDFKSG